MAGSNFVAGPAGSVGSSLGWSMATDLAAKLAVLVTTFIAAHALDTRHFGGFVGFTAVVLLSSSLWDLGLTTVLTREVASGHIRLRPALQEMAILRLRLSPVWIAAFGIGAMVLSRGLAIGATGVFAFAAASVVFSTNMALGSILRAKLRFRYAGIATLAGRWVTAAGSVSALTVGSGQRAIGVLAAALLLGETTSAVISVFGISQELRQGSALRTPGKLSIRAALPFALNGILAVAYNRFDVVILAVLSSVSQLALYAPASRIQDALYLVPSSLGLVALPFIATAHNGRTSVEASILVKRLILLGLAVALPLTAVTFVFAPELIALVLGPKYQGAVLATRVLVWFLPFAVIEAPILASLTAMGRGIDTTKIFAVTFATAVGMHLCLDWWLGALGAALSSVSRDPAAALLCLVIARKAGIIGRHSVRPFADEQSLSTRAAGYLGMRAKRP